MIRILLIALLITVLPLRAPAAEADLYTGAAVVSGQGAAERGEALPQALAQVLRKLSGERDLERYPGFEEALQQAPSLLVSFHYRTVEHPMPDDAVREELRLMAQFSETGVDEILRRLQLPLWPPQRRPAEIWLVIDDGSGRRVLPAEFDYLRFALDDAAGARGLPLRWPRPDEEGMYPVDIQLLWGGYTEDLASPNGDGVLILTAGREGPFWNLRANLGLRDRNWSWRRQDLDLQAGLVGVLQAAIDQVALASSIAPGDLGAWSYELRVDGVRGPADYRDVLAWLQGLSIVDGVAVSAARPAQLTFRLGLTAMPRYLQEAVANSRLLEYDAERDLYRMRGSVDEP